MVVIKAKAPCRIGICGGGTDLPEFFNSYGGAVLNCGITLFSYVNIYQTQAKYTEITSYDWGFTRKITDLNFEFSNNVKNVDIVKASMRHAGLNPKDGYKMVISSSANKNSGLAGSSSLCVALMAAMRNISGKQMLNRYALSNHAYHIEREMLKRVGGYQDMAAAVFGGINFMEFDKHHIIINPLRLESDLLAEIHSSMLLFELPIQREVSASSLEQKRIENIKKNVDCLTNMKDMAYDMKNALMQGKTDLMGEILEDSWIEKRKLEGATNPAVDRFHDIGIKAGAYGGKICGAGGGGTAFFMCNLQDRKNIINKMTAAGCTNVPFAFDMDGITTWRTD